MMKDGEPCPMHEGKPCTKMLHGKHGKAMKADMNEGSRALAEATAKMHSGMDIPFSGDVDIDFLRGMIAHHQGAVEMAQAQLKFGKDAQVRRLAQEIIRAQNLEIRWMQTWLGQLEAKRAGYNDKNWTGKSWLGER
jgi:uncharacterized protein (DUF305 family)